MAGMGIMGAVAHFAGATKPAASAETTLSALSSTPAVELPAVAARLVRQAKPELRAMVAEEVLQDIVAVNRGCVVPYVVSAMVKQSPEVAAPAAVAASKLQPNDPLPSVKAAVAAAPEQADAIVFAFAREFPEAYPTVAVLAASEMPKQSAAILAAIGRAIPALQPFVDRSLAQFGASQVDVLQALKQVEQMAANAGREQTQKTGTAKAPAPASAIKPTKSQFPTLEQFARAEIVRTEPAATPAPTALASARSVAAKAATPLIAPAPLKVPPPSEIKAAATDFGVRDDRIYSRP